MVSTPTNTNAPWRTGMVLHNFLDVCQCWRIFKNLILMSKFHFAPTRSKLSTYFLDSVLIWTSWEQKQNRGNRHTANAMMLFCPKPHHAEDSNSAAVKCLQIPVSHTHSKSYSRAKALMAPWSCCHWLKKKIIYWEEYSNTSSAHHCTSPLIHTFSYISSSYPLRIGVCKKKSCSLKMDF